MDEQTGGKINTEIVTQSNCLHHTPSKFHHTHKHTHTQHCLTAKMIELWLPRTTTAICLLSASRLEPTDCLFGQSSYFQCTVSDLIGWGGGNIFKTFNLFRSTTKVASTSKYIITMEIQQSCLHPKCIRPVCIIRQSRNRSNGDTVKSKSNTKSL